jgi:formylglycine-generating enzyme required for sulfatase activity
VTATNGGSYCVDSTEVTNAQYAQFLVANDPVQIAQCAWNTSFTPSDGWPATGRANHPVVFVDWCDAFAYCQWAGKRLCGKIGGGPNAPADHANAGKSQWFNACSAGATKTYPYGSSYDGTKCNGSENPQTSGAVTVASLASCQGGVPGLFDLSGNVWEWEDSCTGNIGVNDICRVRGGSYESLQQSLRCDTDQNFYRNAYGVVDGFIGFRCCAR